MSTSQSRIAGFALGIIAVLLLIFWNPLPTQPTVQHPELNLPSIDSNLQNPATLSRAEVMPKANPTQPSSFSWLLGKVQTENQEVVPAGTIDFSPPASLTVPVDLPPEALATTVPIHSGEFRFPSWWIEGRELNANAFLLLNEDGIPSPIQLVKQESDKDLILIVGQPHSFSCLVTDLDDNPIAGAFVQVFSPSPFKGYGGETNSDGRLEGTVYSSSSQLGLRTFAEGYLWKSAVLDLSLTGSFTIQLRPIYAAVVLRKDWVHYRHLWTLMPGDRMDDCSGYPRLSSLRDRISATLPIPPAGYRHDIRLAFARKSVADASPVLSLNVWGASFNSDKALKVSMLPVAEGIPEVVVVPEEAYPTDVPPSFPILITLGPKSAFIASPPKKLRLPFALASGDDEGFTAMGDWVSDTTYQFFLPTGKYDVGLTRESHLEEDWYTASFPRFLDGTQIEVVERTNSTFMISMHPDERFIQFDLRINGSNRPTTIAALMAPSDGEPRSFWPTLGSWPQKRFIRPGTFNVWYIDRSLTMQGLSPCLILVGGIVWPSILTHDGTWQIDVIHHGLSTSSFTAG